MVRESSTIKFFDSNFWVGENVFFERFSVKEENLEKILMHRKNQFNINETLVNHFSSFFYHPVEGNNILANILNRNVKKNVFGILFLEQDFFLNPRSFKKVILKRHSSGFKVLRLCPKSHKYPYEVSLLEKFYEILNYYKFPIIINLEEIDITGDKTIEWTNLLKISKKFKKIPIIIDGGNSKELQFNSFIFLLIQNSTNIYFNTHNLFAMNQIEEISKMDPKRLIFDSYFPYYDTYLSIERIMNSDLNEDDKRKIASLNILRILSEIEI
jgi:hypothetical protein